MGIKTCISTCALFQAKKWDIFSVGIGTGAINGQGRGNIDQDSGIFGPGGLICSVMFGHCWSFVDNCLVTVGSILGYF